MATSTVTSKGQITLPKDVREDLGLREGDQVSFEKIDGRYVLRPQNKDAMALAGILHRPGQKALTIAEMNAAMVDGLAEDDERIRSYGAKRARRR